MLQRQSRVGFGLLVLCVLSFIGLVLMTGCAAPAIATEMRNLIVPPVRFATTIEETVVLVSAGTV
jgi:hypothetical protein